MSAGDKGGKGGTNSADSKSGANPACPVCDRPRVAEHRPFCSSRCAQLDLGRWLKGSYRIPTDEEPGPMDGDPDGHMEAADDDPEREN